MIYLLLFLYVILVFCYIELFIEIFKIKRFINDLKKGFYVPKN